MLGTCGVPSCRAYDGAGTTKGLCLRLHCTTGLTSHSLDLANSVLADSVGKHHQEAACLRQLQLCAPHQLTLSICHRAVSRCESRVPCLTLSWSRLVPITTLECQLLPRAGDAGSSRTLDVSACFVDALWANQVYVRPR